MNINLIQINEIRNSMLNFHFKFVNFQAVECHYYEKFYELDNQSLPSVNLEELTVDKYRRSTSLSRANDEESLKGALQSTKFLTLYPKPFYHKMPDLFDITVGHPLSLIIMDLKHY